ncbi:MAG: PD40 domain-containing protein [Chloroflexi bacterium]|nr:PD40 domain-containing protein [Chloroflexota bacterium]
MPSIGRPVDWRWGAAMGAALALLVVGMGALVGPGLGLSAPWGAPTPTATSTVAVMSRPTPAPPMATPTPIPFVIPAPTTPIATEGWKTYVNSTYGYSIMYPPGAQVFYNTPDMVFINLRSDSPGIVIRRDANPMRLTGPQWVDKMVAVPEFVSNVKARTLVDSAGEPASRLLVWGMDRTDERIYVARDDQIFVIHTVYDPGGGHRNFPHLQEDYPIYKRMMETFTFIPIPPTPTPTFTPSPTPTRTPASRDIDEGLDALKEAVVQYMRKRLEKDKAKATSGEVYLKSYMPAEARRRSPCEFEVVVIIYQGYMGEEVGYYSETGFWVRDNGQWQLKGSERGDYTALPLKGIEQISAGRIAFTRGGDIFLLDTSTGRETKVVERRSKKNLQFEGPVWSPEGRIFAYADHALGVTETSFPQLFLYDTTTETSRRLKAVEAVTRPTWSPNGKYIVADVGTAAASRGLTLVDVERDRRLGIFSYRGEVMWSPDQTQLALARNKDIRLGVEGGGGSSLVVVTIYDDVAQETLFLEGSNEYIYGPLRWLEDSSLVYYRSEILDYEALREFFHRPREHEPPPMAPTYWLYQRGEEPVQLPEDDPRTVSAKAKPKDTISELLPKNIIGSVGPNVTFSPDGKWVAFNGGRFPDYSIFAVRSDGSGEVSRLTHGFAPSWEPK